MESSTTSDLSFVDDEPTEPDTRPIDWCDYTGLEPPERERPYRTCPECRGTGGEEYGLCRRCRGLGSVPA